MENRTINIGVVTEVAIALKELNDEMVFVGGATISLYTDDPAAGEIRPTGDIDMTVRMSYSYGEWASKQERLAQLGIHPDPDGASICSYKYQNIPLDIMLSDDGHMGPSNKWYTVGFDNIQTVALDGVSVQILTAPCFLATKFAAFNDRGGDDYRTSHDFEDIIYVIDNRINIVKEIENDHAAIRTFLIDELSKVINHPASKEILSCHIHPLVLKDRLPILLEKVHAIINQ